MAAYPSTLPILRTSATQRDGGFDAARATNGALRVRQRFSAEKLDFTIEHMLSTADKNTLEAFYQANKLLNVSLVWPEDGFTYTVRFVGAPTHYRSPGWWVCRVRLSEV